MAAAEPGRQWHHGGMRAKAHPLVNPWPRRGRWLGALLGVVLVHAWLIQSWHGRPVLGAAPGRVMQVVAPRPAPVVAGAAPAATPTPRAVPPATAAAAAPAQTLDPADAPPVAATVAAHNAPTQADAPPDEADAAAPGEPPPVYPTRIPPPVTLQFALRYNGRAGQATLAWQHDGQHYTLQLDGRGTLQALVEQRSTGGFDSAGLAPERLVDRRRGKGWQAAHFQRETGRISFSGPQAQFPAWAGAQDRLSWVVQMAAILSAMPAPPPELALFVVDARGHGGLWRFAPQGEVLVDTAAGPVTAQLWRRDPPRPEGLRVEAWLDPHAGHWPVQLRFTAVRSGDVFELRPLTEAGGRAAGS
jgi:hypothetical protein